MGGGHKKYAKWFGHYLANESGAIGADSGMCQFKKYLEWFGHSLACKLGRINADSGICQFKNLWNGPDMIWNANRVQSVPTRGFTNPKNIWNGSVTPSYVAIETIRWSTTEQLSGQGGIHCIVVTSSTEHHSIRLKCSGSVTTDQGVIIN
jgi:hypothetical protein